jgi:multiple sugar transport system permease protein
VPVAAVYALLAAIGYVYLYPVLFMVANSLKSLDDLLSPVVKWIPTGWYPDNFRRAAAVMGFWPVLGQTLVAAALPAVAGTAAAAVAGYGFARFRFPLRGLWFALMLATFVLPPQVTMIPEFLMYRRLGLIGSVASFIVPALLGQGLRSAVFILIFFQFTRMLPKSMEEAAVVDGAGPLKIFLRIFVPLSGPAFLVGFLFAFVWYWNETYLASLYFQDTWKTLPLQLARFVASYERMYPPGASVRDRLNEGIKMAGTVLSILPVLVVYAVLQRWFVEGVDRTGITGE